MKNLGKITVVLVTLLVVSVKIRADDLIQVYQQALINDPTFKKAQADWLTAKENLPLAMTGNGVAGSGLFPNLDFTASTAKNYSKIFNNQGSNEGQFLSASYAISLTQPIFNISTWLSISSARFFVKAATATYLAAAQDLMSRTAQAYFEVLRANAKLTLTLAQQKQFLQQLMTAEEQFKVGLIAITGVYNAEASYDTSIADEIGDRNRLQDAIENLRAITGIRYTALADLKAKIPLVIPRPNNIGAWVAVAVQQNYQIQSDLNTMLSARENIKIAATANLPTVSFVGSWSASRAGGVYQPPVEGTIPATTTQVGSAGLQLNFPIFRGGYDIANTKQTRYEYLSASDQLAIDHRTVENNTRKAFLLIDSSISQIMADEHSILSASNQLDATKAGYIVGTRTMVDLLNSVTTLTQTQQSYADDRYNYVEAIVTLKQQAGVLSPNDLALLNCWLGAEIKFSLKQPKYIKRPQIKIPKDNITIPMSLPDATQDDVPPTLQYQNSQDKPIEPVPVKEKLLPNPMLPNIQTQPPIQPKPRLFPNPIIQKPQQSTSNATVHPAKLVHHQLHQLPAPQQFGQRKIALPAPKSLGEWKINLPTPQYVGERKT